MGFRKKRHYIKKKLEFNQQEPDSKELITFLGKVMQLKPVEFIGILKVMCIQYYDIVDGKPKTRDIDTLLSEIIDQYVKIPAKQREELYRVVEDTLKAYTKGEI